jgi:hypothetical protein
MLMALRVNRWISSKNNLSKICTAVRSELTSLGLRKGITKRSQNEVWNFELLEMSAMQEIRTFSMLCLNSLNIDIIKSVVINAWSGCEYPLIVYPEFNLKLVFYFQGPLSLVSTTEELLKEKVAAPI